MTGVTDRLASLIVRRPWAVLAVSLAAAAVLSSGMSRLTVNPNPEQHLPGDHPYVWVDRRIRREFGGRNFVAIALVSRTGTVWTHDVLQAVHTLTDSLLDAPGVMHHQVVSLSSPYVRIVRDRGGVLAVDYLMKDVPEDDAGIVSLRDLYRNESLFRGTLVSEDEKAALVFADFYDGVSTDDIATTVDQAVAKVRSPQIDLAVAGEPMLAHAESRLVRQQGLYFAGTVGAILLVLYLAFGQIQGVVLPFGTALTSTLCALGFMGFAGIALNAWTTAVPVVVMTIAAGHSAQMLKRYYEEFVRFGDRKVAVAESTARMAPVMVAAGGTAGSGFAALSLVGVPTIAQFGLGVGAGIFAAVALELTFMPALRVLWPMGRARSGEGPLSRVLGSILSLLEGAVSRHPRSIVSFFAAVALLALAGLPRLETDIDVRRYWPETTPFGRDLRLFEQHFPSTQTLTVLLEGKPGSMETPHAIRLMAGLQRAMQEDPDVGRTSSLADIVQRTYEVFAPEEAVRGLPIEPSLVAQLLFLADSPAFERYVDRTHSRSVVYGFLKSMDSRVTRRVIARLETYLQRNSRQDLHVYLAGGAGPITLAINEYTVNGKALSIGVLLGVVFVLAALLMQSAIAGALVVMPLVMVLIVVIGLFSWLGIAFDIAGSSIATIGVGIGADYAIYFLYRLREGVGQACSVEKALAAAMQSSGRAVLFVAMAIAAGFAVFGVADYLPLKLSGVFIPLTMAVSSLTSLTLLPALTMLLRPSFVFARPLQRAAAVRSSAAL